MSKATVVLGLFVVFGAAAAWRGLSLAPGLAPSKARPGAMRVAEYSGVPGTASLGDAASTASQAATIPFFGDASGEVGDRQLDRRPVRPVECDLTYWGRFQPIFDTLPHMERADIHKLRFFCPADFNKDDVVDERDLALFAQSWGDEASPLFNWCDVNGDGFVDAADAIEFLRQFNEGPRDGEVLKEQRLLAC